MQITLLDSLQKRLTFLKEVLAQCALSARCIHLRAEDGGRQPDLREQFDAATARAVANLRDLSEYCLPYVKPGGRFYALKGGDVTEETQNAQKAIQLLGGQTEKIFSYSLPDGSGRTLVLIKKISRTSTKFPRSAAKIAKSPLA